MWLIQPWGDIVEVKLITECTQATQALMNLKSFCIYEWRIIHSFLNRIDLKTLPSQWAQCTVYIDYTWLYIINLSVHVPQGYSSWVWLCVSSSIFQTVTNRPRWPMGRLSTAIVSFITFFVKQPLCEAAEFEWQPYWLTCRPFCLPLQAPKRISTHVTAFSTTWCFCSGFCHWAWRSTI